MVTTLLQVALLLMGVGAKASTPVYLKKQPHAQKQQRQKQNANDDRYIDFSATCTTPNEWHTSHTVETSWTYSHNRKWTGTTTANNTDLIVTQTIYETDILELNREVNNNEFYGYPYETVGLNANENVYATSMIKALRIESAYEIDNSTISYNYKPSLYALLENPSTQYVYEYSFTYTTLVFISKELRFQQFLTMDYTQDALQYKTYSKIKEYSDYQMLTFEQTINYEIDGGPSMLDADYIVSQPTADLTINLDITNRIGKGDNYIVFITMPTEFRDHSQSRRIGTHWFDFEAVYLGDTADTMNSRFFYGQNITITGTFDTVGLPVEVVDIPGIMWEILTMPFAFISTAFNLTIFPNTPYQINFSNLFMTIFGALVFIWIMGIVRKKL